MSMKLSSKIIKDIKELPKLQHEAEEAAKFRGHKLGRWGLIGLFGQKDAFRATCKKCGMEVDVTAYPKANETSISGEAIALGCNKKGYNKERYKKKHEAQRKTRGNK
jgi:hypothetical protein